MAWNFVNQARPNQAAVETSTVVVANLPIGVRTVISPEMVRVQNMPVDAVHPQAMHSIDQVIGKVARIEMSADEPVLTTKVFLQRGESGLAFMVAEGMRAISVNFNEVSSSGGMVSPGDHVDVLGVFDVKAADANAGAKASQTKPVVPTAEGPGANSSAANDDKISLALLALQDVEVLAVAQQLEGDIPPSQQQQSSGLPTLTSSIPSGTAAQALRAEPTPMPQAKTATVAVTP